MDKMPVDEMTVNRIKVKKMSKLNIHRQVFRGKMSVDEEDDSICYAKCNYAENFFCLMPLC